jgi:outer membrane protein OmpA-like peptidoglycan-associated protein
MTIFMRFTAALLALTVGACSSTPPPRTDRVERARAEVQAATADPAVQQYARPELDSAQDAFASAELSVRRKLDTQVIDHWAYLAEQRAAIARETGRLRRAEAEIRAAEVERTQPVQVEPAALAPAASGAAEPSRPPVIAPSLVLRDDQFAGDGALKPEAAAEIDRIARTLQDDTTRMARIDSHSEDMNSRSRSIEFSGRRAELVRSELVRRGIDARRVAVRALGDSYPVASNETALGRQRNRRVDIYVVPVGATQPSP